MDCRKDITFLFTRDPISACEAHIKATAGYKEVPRRSPLTESGLSNKQGSSSSHQVTAPRWHSGCRYECCLRIRWYSVWGCECTHTNTTCSMFHLDVFFLDSRTYCINVCNFVCIQMINWLPRREKRDWLHAPPLHTHTHTHAHGCCGAARIGHLFCFTEIWTESTAFVHIFTFEQVFKSIGWVTSKSRRC